MGERSPTHPARRYAHTNFMPTVQHRRDDRCIASATSKMGAFPSESFEKTRAYIDSQGVITACVRIIFPIARLLHVVSMKRCPPGVEPKFKDVPDFVGIYMQSSTRLLQ